MFAEDLVFLDAEIESKKEILDFLACKLFDSGRIPDLEAFLQDVAAREETCPTAIGGGVALPHGINHGQGRAAAAFARLKEPVDWGGGEVVNYVFLLAVPVEEKGSGYIEAIGRLSRFLLEEESFKGLESVRTTAEAFELLSGI